MTTCKNTIFILTIILLSSFLSFATSYTWNGNTNTHWYTSTNWSPGGIPGSGDNVTISGGAGANNLLMDSSKTVTTFTISADSIDVGADTLTITSTATFSGGRIFSSTGGHVKVNSTVTTTFSGTVFNVTLNISSNALLFSGSTFNNTLTAVKNGTSSDNGTGNNIFNGSVTLTNSGTGNLVLSNSTSSPDTFNSTLTVSATNSGGVYLAHQGADNVFNGNVTFSTGKVFSNTYGTAAYNGNITLNSTSGNISFGNSTGSWSLASGKNISIGTFSAGTLTIRNLTQNDSTINMSLVLSGTGILTLGAGNYIRANLYAKSNGLTFTQSRFFGLDTLILTGGTGPFSSGGGNYFGKSVYIANTYAGGNLTWIAGSTSVDTFATKAVLETSGLGTIDIRKGLFLGATTFKNSTTNASDKIYIKDGIFKDSVILNSIYGGISFRQGTGNNLLDSTASLTLSSGFKAHLQLSYLDQRGSHAINFNMTGTSSGTYNQLEIGPGASFQAIFTYLGQGLLLNGGTFSSDASFTRISQQVDVSSGGNIFNGATYICDSVSSTSTIDKPFKLANSIADDFNGNVTFRLYAGGSSPSYVKFYPAYTKNSTFADSVTVDGNAGIDFGANGGKIIFDGSGVQKISKTGTYNPTVKNVDVNKSGGYLKLSVPLAIDTLKLIKGIVVTDTTNIISIPDNGKITSAYGTDGGSDTGYVHGPIKKTGNDAFTFATGDTTLHAYPYHPLKFITTPGASDVYMVQYFGHGSGIADSDTLDSAQVSTCEYWNLKRDVGTTGVKVRLGYTNTCPVGDPARAVVMDYNGSLWQNEGNSAYGGNLVDAADTSLFAAGTSHPVTVGIHSAINVAVVSPAGGTVYSADVRKWEKYEVAVQLPQSYMDCINNYLSHRILHQDTVDHSHDLNPFADDSLIMIMTLQKPGGGTITKYGFFMREVQWLADAPSGDYKTNNDTNSLSDYHIHFRFAPDTLSSSPWIYSIYIAAPFTKVTGTASNLLPIYLGPYFFTCDSLQPENHGFLKVNTNNNRFLIHDDGTPFFGIGDIEADFDKYWDYDGDAYLPKSSGTIYNRLYKTDYDRWKTTIDEIHEAGGNYMCMFFLNRSFKPEYEYLGWYDEFDTMPVSCYYGSGGSPKSGNRQWGLRVFDNLLDEAHAKQVYLQLVLDYEMPGPYQVDGWGGNALVHKYVYPTGIPIGVDTFQAPYAHPEYYWTGKDTSDTNDPGALYWWKRQYKYIMSRWGYSVNIAMYQTTSELDQSLKYHTSSSRDECDTSVTLTYSENSAIPAAYSTFIDTVV
ncbi:MAG: hypothetical protein NTV09_13340, partial [Bacteroidetes bacterium]|nr:hypothetical protein [Bacteroidota bacterium]